jgi:arsenite methyltransferase
LLSIVAGQLGRPHGLLGRGVAIMLNRGNRRSLAAAVQATDIAPGGVAADIGFGGGVGLGLLLDRVGDDGLVHGVEVSEDMLRRARSRFAAHVEAGRLRLTDGSLTAVPLDDNSVDAAITVNTVYFVPELDAACAELARVLRPGGRAVVGIGDPEAMARLPFTSYGFTLRPVSDVIAALQKAGLDVVEHPRLDDVAIAHHLLVARRAS